MKIEFDEDKRVTVLRERGLDFARAGEIFNGPGFDIEDARFDYGETRILTFGVLDERNVVVVWTFRDGDVRRIISMRYVHERELEARKRSLD